MFSLSELKQTRFYQEALEEGRLEGEKEGRRKEGLSLVLRLINRQLGSIRGQRLKLKCKNCLYISLKVWVRRCWILGIS